MKLQARPRIALTWLACSLWLSCARAEEVLFEDRFDEGLSARWQVVGMGKDDYRIRDGGLEVRLRPDSVSGSRPMLKVGPSAEGKYQNFFHSAISQADSGLGFALVASGDGAADRWVRFDNFRVVKP